MMAADADQAGNADKATPSTPSAAETIAGQLVQVEKDVESLKAMVIESTQAADQAKAAVSQNSRLLQDKIAEKSKLVSQLEQAKMQEEMNSAMEQLNETVGDDVPTLKEVEEKIQARYAKAKAASELHRDVGRVEHARDRAGDRQRRGPEPPQSELRAELGLDSATAGRPPRSKAASPPPESSESGQTGRARRQG